MNLFTQNLLKTIMLLVALVMFNQKAMAVSPLASDLQGLVSEANAFNTQLVNISMGADAFCGELLSANQSANTYVTNVENVNASLASPISLDADILQALQDLSAVNVSLATQAIRLSTDLNALSASVDQLSIAQGISAMLRLSDDIGAMADRIGEMSDRILVMSDNIGLMADNILITQQIQNDNVTLTQQNMLTAQTNVINLVAQIDTSVYNTELLSQMSVASLLQLDMEAVVLNALNAATELATVALDVDSLKLQIQNLDSVMSADAVNNTMTINQQSLLTLMDLSGKLAAMAIAVDGYAIAVDGLNAVSATPTLEDSVGSILSLSADIGVMANRIGEEADLILAMADSIGVQAEQILLVQQQQSLNVATTQAALLNAQELMIGLIVNYGL